MMAFLFYTPEGYTTSPNDSEVDNFQILGIEQGAHVQDALKTLIEENEWIKSYGFSLKKIKYYQTLFDKP